MERRERMEGKIMLVLLDLLYVYDVVELVNLVVNNPLLLGTQLVVC